MKKIKLIATVCLLLNSLLNYSQENSEQKKIKITGKIVEKGTNQPLEYATISLVNTKNPKIITGAITNDKGEFSVDAFPGVYNIKAEFISFKPLTINNKVLKGDTNIGFIYLEPDATQLKEVVIKTQKATVEIKLDKKIYNVGQDATAKGGTASDVLDNVPSVTVDGDGNVSLRGNDNVKILIDGRPSNAINIADALKTISADALDKVEVITNPSSRYDAEGGAGIINIILKKGKNQGLNGVFIGTVGDPKNYGINGTVNFKSENFNLFTGIGYSDAKGPGKSLTNSNYLNPDGSIYKSINERLDRIRGRQGYNYSFGVDWYLDKSLTWTNAFNFRKNDGNNPENNVLYNYEPNNTFIQNRYNDQFTKTRDIEYTSNLTKNFKKDGHKLTFDFAVTKNFDNDFSTITNSYAGSLNSNTKESVVNLETQNRNLFQTDYVLPIGKNSQFEAGYKGDFNELLVDYRVGSYDASGNYTPYPTYTNVFQYKEKINALYSQFGSKISKFSYLLGIRYEDTNLNINLLSTNNFNTKKYNNFFPSAFLTYEISDESSLSLNYSKRISRPRNRFISPFSNYSSNINIFQGNPDINPSFTDAIDLGYLHRWKKITLTTSLYYNKTKNFFQFIRRPNGETVSAIVNGQLVDTPVYLSTPVNLDKDERIGFEFNLNYTPVKWWKLNGSFNFFQSKVQGNYQYILNGTTDVIVKDGSANATSWFTKFSSRITLPFKIDWQTNGTYNAPQNNSQGKSLGVYGVNMAFSKDILKDKATLSLNINDLFNSRKRISQTNLPTLDSYSENQFRVRQINFSFTYRFNKQKTDREKAKKQNPDGNDGGDFQG